MLGGGLCILTVAEIKERMNEFFQRKREEKRINRKRMRGSMHISCSKDFQGLKLREVGQGD